MAFTVTIVGGTGVFGRYIVEELLKSSIDFKIIVASRDKKQFFRYYSDQPTIQFEQLDLHDDIAVDRILDKTNLMILAAGPFQGLSSHIAIRASQKGVHYIDICDDPTYLSSLYEHKDLFASSKAVALSGLSSLPGISVLLMESIRSQFDHIEDISIGLFIGNKNQKGRAAVTSAIKNLSRAATFIEDGKLRSVSSWSNAIDYAYPAPIGVVPSYSFPTPDAILFSKYYSCKNLSVRVGFEWALARTVFSFFKSVSDFGYQRLVEKITTTLYPIFSMGHFIGSEGGCVSLIVCGTKGDQTINIRASLRSDRKGQRMASIPAVIAAEAIARGELKSAGLLDLNQWIKPDLFFQRMSEKGMMFQIERLA